jgi:hypothetical protein
MSFSLDTPSARSLKAEARALREERARAGMPLSHSAALEEVAHAHGYRDWNTARAALPDRVAAPFQVGERVRGTYLSQPYSGMLIGVHMMGDMQHYQVTILFDQPVNVTPNFMFEALRKRVSGTVDIRGISPALRGDGTPQLVIERT